MENQSASVVKQTFTAKHALLVFSIILVAFNLRPAITAVGPLVSSIRIDTGISSSLAGLLTTLPLLAFAAMSPAAPRLGQRFSNERMILIALLVLTSGILIRSTGILTPMFIGTAFIGLGIAICNVLLPGIVKKNFPTKVGLMTSIYTTSMAVWAAIGSGISFPLAEGFHLGWEKSLAVWATLSSIAIVFWIPQLRKDTPNPTSPFIARGGRDQLWRSPLAWQVTLFMGLQSFLYYCLIAWLPEILTSKGLPIETAGWMLSIMQFAGLPATFLAPVLADRFSDQRGIVIAIGAFAITGISGLLIGGNTIVLTLFVLCLGMAQGAAISLALTLLGLRSANPKQAASLSGMAQSMGYLLAAVGPFTLGIMFDTFHSWTIPLYLLLIISFTMILAGLGAGRNKVV